MTIDEARVIFKSWQDHMEIFSKFQSIMLPIPESFLPYPADVLEEALNIFAKNYFDSGNKKMSAVIQKSMAFCLPTQTDEEALTQMKKMLDLIEQDDDLKKTVLKNLKECQDSWIKSRVK